MSPAPGPPGPELFCTLGLARLNADDGTVLVEVNELDDDTGGWAPCWLGIGPLAEDTAGCPPVDCRCEGGGVLLLRPDSGGKLLREGGPANKAKGPAPGPKPAKECGSK